MRPLLWLKIWTVPLVSSFQVGQGDVKMSKQNIVSIISFIGDCQRNFFLKLDYAWTDQLAISSERKRVSEKKAMKGKTKRQGERKEPSRDHFVQDPKWNIPRRNEVDLLLDIAQSTPCWPIKK